MRKKIKVILFLFILIIIYIYIANITLLPKNVLIMQGEKLDLRTFFGVNIVDNKKTKEASSRALNESMQEGNKSANLELFNIPVGKINVNVISKTKVIPLGNAIGLKLYTDGVLVVGMSQIEGKKPYENTGIKEGDRIISINNNNVKTTEELIETVNSSNGKEISIKYISENDNKEEETNITPIKTKDNEYKIGLWVRDAAAGVGTATFYEPKSNMFASLGHGITDIDTGNLITISNGELGTTNLVSLEKGEKGKPGELRGSIEGSKKIGEVSKNTSFGIFGRITNKTNFDFKTKEMEVALRDEIKRGKAQIICEVEEGKIEYYDIEIQKIYLSNNNDNKSMLIKITDKRLLEKTGGIIQGMSGSPIIQNGKFIGAVTHVLVKDPTTGYGVFGDIMIKKMSETK